MLQFRSKELPTRRRLDLANRAMHEWYGSRLVWDSDSSSALNVEMSLTQLGHTRFSVHQSTDGRIINRPEYAGSMSTYVLHAALCGRQKLEIGGTCFSLEPGEFTLTSVATSMVREPGEDLVAASLQVPSDLMRRYVAAPERIFGLVFPGHGLAGNISGLMRSMVEMGQSQTLSAYGGRLSLHVLDLLGLCSQALDATKARAGGAEDDWVHRIKVYVAANIHSPALRVEAVAAHFGVSTRYIHTLFARVNDTLSAYIRRERLERCRAELENTATSSRSISDVAFDWGFSDLSHFCRTFRRAHGISARDYRKRALKMAANKLVSA